MMRLKKTNKNTSNKVASATSGKSVIGLDISQYAIRMVQLSGKQLNQVQLEKYAIEYLPQNVVSGSEIVNYDELVSHLQQCYSKLKTNCKQVNMALPFSTVTIEENSMYDPSIAEISLQEFVESEVATFGTLDEMNYDWNVVGQNTATQEQNVLIVAAKTENIDKATDLLDEVGLSAINIDVDLFAIANSFIYADELSGHEFPISRTALFDIGDTTMKTLILENGKIVYKQESHLGLEQLIQLIQRNYQVSDAEALSMVHGSGSRPTDYHEYIMVNFNMQIAQEIQRALQFFFATQSGESIVKEIYISGSGCIANSGLETAVYSETGINVRQIAPASLANNKSKTEVVTFDKDANSLTMAFGLALRGLV
ncbi:MAG: type IV pilus assembly protein PilM [Alysiella sp.]|uniref:type IV pilus biogenesis protein PilM n=1 Tax=Alysiella sp. TaxID=1872483 RepID=UPI0026DD6EA2|nr:type IV pilus assembly protein PilM [Alysiella sp.]MDO4434172.1 type IV pilus assembly protein PilM [Alysiella sp.]